MEASSENMKPSICQFSSLFYYVNETKDRHLLMTTFPAGEGEKKKKKTWIKGNSAGRWLEHDECATSQQNAVITSSPSSSHLLQKVEGCVNKQHMKSGTLRICAVPG